MMMEYNTMGEYQCPTCCIDILSHIVLKYFDYFYFAYYYYYYYY